MATSELNLQTSTNTADLANGSIFFVGTATTLIRFAGFTILTDPNFLHRGDHVHLGYGLTSRRVTEPAIDIEDLPPVDFVLLSHMHEDHFDRLVQRQLDLRVPIVTTPDAANELAHIGFRAPWPLDTWETLTVRKGDERVEIAAMPGRHGGPIISKALPPVMGSMLEFYSGAKGLLRMYISGDTLLFDDLKQIPHRFPDIDIALLHLGGTRVLGILVTMDGEQGTRAVQLLQPQVVIPIHYNDYTVFKSPLEDFQRHIRAAGLEDRVRYLRHGEAYQWRIPQSRL